jgi:hypothetical protein
MTKEIIKKNEKSLSNLDKDFLNQLSQDSEEFGLDATQEEIILPRITLLQNLSDAVTKGNTKKIEGAEAGDLLEVITETVYKAETGILFVPVKMFVSYIEWEGEPKGKIINNYGDDATFYIQQKNAGKINPKGKVIGTAPNRTIEKNINYYGYILNEKNNETSPVLIPFSKTKVKIAQKFNTMILSKKLEGKNLPPFSYIYRIFSVLEQNEKGSWANFKVENHKSLFELEKEVALRIYNDAKKDRKAFEEGQKKINMSFDDEDLSETAQSSSETKF